MNIRLEDQDDNEEDGEVMTSYAVLDDQDIHIATAYTVQRGDCKVLDSVSGDMHLKNALYGETFKEALEHAESLVEVLRQYAALENKGVIECVSSQRSPSAIWFELMPERGCQAYSTDEELLTLVAEKCSVLD